MNTSDARAAALTLLLEEDVGPVRGRKQRLAKRIGKSPAQVSQWLSGYRTIEEATAREIEAAAAKPKYWMDSIDDSPPSPLPAPIPASAQQVPALPADLADRLTRLGDEQRRQVLEVLRATLGVAENAKPLGAPIATEHQQTLQQLSDQAEAQHAASKQRRRPAGG